MACWRGFVYADRAFQTALYSRSSDRGNALLLVSIIYFVKRGRVIFTLSLYSGMKSSHLMPFLKASWMASRPVNGW